MITNTYRDIPNSNTTEIAIYDDGRLRKGRIQFYKKDWKIVKKHTWVIDTKGYARCTRCNQLMHRLLLPKAKEVDHIDGNGWNNNGINLREVTHAQNMKNKKTSNKSNIPVGGLHWTGSTWRITLENDKKRRYVGSCPDLKDAICWKIRAEYLAYGEHSKNYRHVLKRMPRYYLVKWFPEIYTKLNQQFVASDIQRAHYKNTDMSIKRQVSIRKAGVAM